MDLEVVAKGGEDGSGKGVGLDGLAVPGGIGLGDMRHVHVKGDREVEGVVFSFVYHDK